jgi:uncharacterized membrane protein
MRTRTERRTAARYRWDRMKVSFWFAPVIMAVAAVLLAWLMYGVDNLVPDAALEDSRFVLAGTPGELRSALLNMAGTVLATAGVVFTLLTLPLSTVASQYGSRLLRVFLGDRTTQFVLGAFVGTFVYCIAAALSIPTASVEQDAPQVTATLGVYLMVATFGTLILLVQHVSTMLQAPNIAAAAGAELLDVVRANAEEVANGDNGNGGSETRPIPDSRDIPAMLTETRGYPVRARGVGYIQYINSQMVLTLAQKKDLVVHLQCKPGCYVQSGAVVALVWPAERVDEQLEALFQRAFRLGNGRTPSQDVEYAVNQLNEMAVRAMSPAINDPFTAMTCLDRIGDGLATFIRQGGNDSHHWDQDGRLRLILDPVTIDDLLDAAFDMLRHASCNNANVLQHMLEVIGALGQEVKAPEIRRQLRRHVSLIQAESQVGNLIEADRQSIRQSSEALQTRLMDGP